MDNRGRAGVGVRNVCGCVNFTLVDDVRVERRTVVTGRGGEPRAERENDLYRA